MGMKRCSVCLTKDMDEKITKLKMTEKYCRASYGEVVRELVKAGIESYEEDQKKETVNG